jgi:hypothetical protein
MWDGINDLAIHNTTLYNTAFITAFVTLRISKLYCSVEWGFTVPTTPVPTDDHLEIRKHCLIVLIPCYSTHSTFPMPTYISCVASFSRDDDDASWPAQRSAVVSAGACK